MSRKCPSSTTVAALLLGVGLCAGAMPASAEERPLLERARAAADQADFEGARAMLAELPPDLELSLEELRTALLLRANLAYALEDPEAMERDLELFVRCAPAAEPPAGLSPLFLERIAAHREANAPLFIEADIEAGDERVVVRLRASPADRLVRQMRLFFRSTATPEWTEQVVDAGGNAELSSEPGLELYAELVGLGGAVLAQSGTREEPLTVSGAGTEDRPRRRVPAWPFALGATVIAAAVAIGLGVGLSVDDGGPTRVAAPVVAW